MADARVTFGNRSREVGTEVGIRVNTFGAERLSAILTGDALEPILHEALMPAFDQAYGNWPVLTGASRDSMRVETDEIAYRSARVSLKVGGQQLIQDARNEQHIDYAPFIEFNGTPTTPPGTIAYAMFSNQADIRRMIHEGVRRLLVSV